MGVSFNLNQFKLGQNIGELMNPGANVIQAQVLPSLSTASYYSAGDVVTFGSTTTGDLPQVKKISTGCGMGVIVFNMKKDKFYANEIVGVALDGSIISMWAATAISRGDVVSYGTSGLGTITSGYGLGIALDTCSTQGLCRILIKCAVPGTGITWF